MDIVKAKGQEKVQTNKLTVELKHTARLGQEKRRKSGTEQGEAQDIRMMFDGYHGGRRSQGMQ